MCADLSRHVHEQHCGHWGLGLAVALIRPVDGVGLQDAVQVLLPVELWKMENIGVGSTLPQTKCALTKPSQTLPVPNTKLTGVLPPHSSICLHNPASQA